MGGYALIHGSGESVKQYGGPYTASYDGEVLHTANLAMSENITFILSKHSTSFKDVFSSFGRSKWLGPPTAAVGSTVIAKLFDDDLDFDPDFAGVYYIEDGQKHYIRASVNSYYIYSTYTPKITEISFIMPDFDVNVDDNYDPPDDEDTVYYAEYTDSVLTTLGFATGDFITDDLINAPMLDSEGISEISFDSGLALSNKKAKSSASSYNINSYKVRLSRAEYLALSTDLQRGEK